MPLSPNREQEIMAFEEVQKELDQPMHCMGCGWLGRRLDVIQVSEVVPVCPDCERADLLTTDIESQHDSKQSVVFIS